LAHSPMRQSLRLSHKRRGVLAMSRCPVIHRFRVKAVRTLWRITSKRCEMQDASSQELVCYGYAALLLWIEHCGGVVDLCGRLLVNDIPSPRSPTITLVAFTTCFSSKNVTSMKACRPGQSVDEGRIVPCIWNLSQWFYLKNHVSSLQGRTRKSDRIRTMRPSQLQTPCPASSRFAAPSGR